MGVQVTWPRKLIIQKTADILVRKGSGQLSFRRKGSVLFEPDHPRIFIVTYVICQVFFLSSFDVSF